MRHFRIGSMLCLMILAAMAVPAGQAWAARQVTLAIVTTPGSAQHVAAVAFKELVENATRELPGGPLTVSIQHSASLGDETAILQQIQLGAVELGIITSGPLEEFVPAVAVISYPYLFASHAQVDAVLDGPLGMQLLDQLGAVGFKGLAFSENGFRHLTNSKRPVHAVADVAGLKIRVMRSAMHHALWRMLGANPTPMGWPIYTELAQGALDGQENPLWVVAEARLHEVQRHLSLTRHVYSAHVCLANQRWFDRLDAPMQQAVQTAMRQAAVQQRAWAREHEASYLEALKAAGMQVTEPDVESFRTRAAGMLEAPVYANPAVRTLLLQVLDAARPDAVRTPAP
ncbi:DctP family TRAP transporter solute-binding subunit [Megalodesulfovibrio gigas]|nr:DctP family TRAP transporter solute-binding subunit [Megalodesulfovibrio gigas]